MLGQKKLLQRLLPGVMHALIFWGFLVLFPTIVMAMIAAVNREWSLPWLGSQGWFMALVDVFIVCVLVGIALAFWIRKVVRPPRFDGSHLGEADLILANDRARRPDAARLARGSHRGGPERVAGVGVVPLERRLERHPGAARLRARASSGRTCS